MYCLLKVRNRTFVHVEKNLHVFEVDTLGRITGKSIVVTKLTIKPHTKTLMQYHMVQKKHACSIFFSSSKSKQMIK